MKPLILSILLSMTIVAAEAPTLPDSLIAPFWKDNAIYHTISEQLQATYTDKQKSIIESLGKQYQLVSSDQSAMAKFCQDKKSQLAGLDKDQPHCELPIEPKPPATK